MSGHELAPARHRELPAEAGEARVDEPSQGAVADEPQLLQISLGAHPASQAIERKDLDQVDRKPSCQIHFGINRLFNFLHTTCCVLA